MRSTIGRESLAAPWRSKQRPSRIPGWLQALQQNPYYRSHNKANLPVRPSFSPESYFEIQPPLGPLVFCYRSFAAETLFCLCESSRFRSASARSPKRHESGSPRRRLSETRSAGKSRVRIRKKSARDSQRKVPTSFCVLRKFEWSQ